MNHHMKNIIKKTEYKKDEEAKPNYHVCKKKWKIPIKELKNSKDRKLKLVMEEIKSYRRMPGIIPLTFFWKYYLNSIRSQSIHFLHFF